MNTTTKSLIDASIYKAQDILRLSDNSDTDKTTDKVKCTTHVPISMIENARRHRRVAITCEHHHHICKGVNGYRYSKL